MTSATSALSKLRRPRLLIRAARHGVAEYDRAAGLARLLDIANASDPDAQLSALLAAEADAEASRKAGAATYSVTRHIELLVALMGEARHNALGARAA